MPGLQGISQADIPKLMKFIKEGKTVEEIADGALLGYRAPHKTIQSFFDRKPVKTNAVSTHPQDVAAAERKADANKVMEAKKMKAKEK